MLFITTPSWTHTFVPMANFLADRYKLSHHKMILDGTSRIYANITPRSSHYSGQYADGDSCVTMVGMRRAVMAVNEVWKDFFANDWGYIREYCDTVLQPNMTANSDYSGLMELYRKLHQLQHLPLKIKALPEGSRVPMKIPMATLINTDDDHAFLTNYIESVFNAEVWKTLVETSRAYEALRLLYAAALKTTGSTDGVEYQAHDFSFRGLSGYMDATNIGIGHLACFAGSDTTSSLETIHRYYHVPRGARIAVAPPATEHMIMTLHRAMGEKEFILRLITYLYPDGIVSIVSDTWDFWAVVTQILPEIKDVIMLRRPDRTGMPGKTVIRPDSGDPLKVICGDPDAPMGSPQYKGALEVLWEIFGGTITPQGYKLLDPHIGLIYGDGITPERMRQIISAVIKKGYASTNVIFGIGSFTYQYVTRDNYSIATKATWAMVDGEDLNMQKDPKTDSGKKSASGLLRVDYSPYGNYGADGPWSLKQNCTPEEEAGGMLQDLLVNGNIVQPAPNWLDLRRNVQTQALMQGCDLNRVLDL